jgi:peptide/nickel transport system permease protein
VPAGLAIALLGTALSLLNFGIDEFVSPRLRSSGKTRVRTAGGHIVRMRVGFTPVLAASNGKKGGRAGDAGTEASAGTEIHFGHEIHVGRDEKGDRR